MNLKTEPLNRKNLSQLDLRKATLSLSLSLSLWQIYSWEGRLGSMHTHCIGSRRTLQPHLTLEIISSHDHWFYMLLQPSNP